MQLISPRSDPEWLCVDVDGHKIINIHKIPSMRLQISELPVFFHRSLYAGDFNSPHTNWGYSTNNVEAECLATWSDYNILSLLYNLKDQANFHCVCWNTGTNPDLTFCRTGSDRCLPQRRILEKFPRSQHRPSLITLLRFSLLRLGWRIRRWNFRKVN